MAILIQLVLHIVVILTLVKECSAYCYGYCLAGSWYIWFVIIAVIAIICSAVCCCVRRRHIQQREVVRVQYGGNVQGIVAPPTSDLSRSYVYPQGTAYPAYQQGPAPPPYNPAVDANAQAEKQPEGPPAYPSPGYNQAQVPYPYGYPSA